MRYILRNSLSKLIVTLAILISILAFVVSYIRLGHVARESQTYNRYTSCILSVPSQEPTQERIDRCWSTVQEDTGVHIKRYDRL